MKNLHCMSHAASGLVAGAAGRVRHGICFTVITAIAIESIDSEAIMTDRDTYQNKLEVRLDALRAGVEQAARVLGYAVRSASSGFRQ